MAATAASNVLSESASTSSPDVSSGAMAGAASPQLSFVATQRGLDAESSRNNGYDATNHAVDLSGPGQRLSDLLGAVDPARRARSHPAANSSFNAVSLRPLPLQNSAVLHDARGGEEDEFDSPELRALKALKWKNGRDLTAHIQDIALQQGKRAMVVTSGGSFKKFVCSSDTPCPWLVNAVCTRPRVRKKTASEASASNNHEEGREPSAETEELDVAKRKYWYVSSAYLLHTNCTGMAKPTARQLKDVSVLKQAVQMDAKISSASLVEQLKSHARLLCSKSMVYKAKTDLLDELEAVEASTSPGTNPPGPPVADQVSTHGFSLDIVQSTQQLPSYLARLSTLNPDVLHAIERDPVSNTHFWRAVAALDPNRFFSQATPLVFGVDSKQDRATSSTLRVAADGSGASTQLLLLGCDANLSTVTYAVALVPEPSELHLTWFLSKLIECGYPLQRANAVFTDGRWPVTAACGRVGVQNMMQDTRYLIEDLSQLIGRQLMGFQQQQQQERTSFSLTADQTSCIWAAQRAESEGEFYAALHKLEISRPTPSNGETLQHPLPGSGVLAAQQLRSVDPRRWAVFPHHSTIRLYGWQTTRISPDAQEDATHSILSTQELRLPCEFFKTFALKLLNEAYHRNELATQWEREQRVVTPEAERLMQDEMKLVPLYEVAMSAPHIAFVWNPREGPQLRQRRVDLQEKTCTCGMRLQFGVPCRHILSVLRKMNALSQSFDYFAECYRVQTFVSVFKGHHIELPLDETIQVDPAWLPPKQFMMAGGSLMAPPGVNLLDPGTMVVPLEPHADQEKTGKRKRRVRVKPTDERKRPLYKCRRCNVADGHNSMTCPKRRNKP